MTLATLGRYLVANRQAIRDIAGCRHALWVGLLFVLSAGFAREFDGEDLLYEPWHLLLPLGASLITSLLLFSIVWMVSQWNPDGVSFWGSYRSFLGLYWMTAPLAWLYAIPVERFLSPADAVIANLWLLAIVAVWRVLLMVQVVSTLFRVPVVWAVFPALLFGDTVAIVLLYLTPLPVVSLMGGIRLSESEQILRSTAFWVGTLGVLTWPLWLVGTFFFAILRKGMRPTVVEHHQHVARTLWGLGALSLSLGIAILPLTQPEQQLRRRVEALLRRGEIREAVQLMSAHERSDFPPHWDPPPRVGYGETEPPLLDAMEALRQADAKPWVTRIYLEKFRRQLGRGYHGSYYFWEQLDDEEFDRYLTLLETLPEGPAFLGQHRDSLASLLENKSSWTSAQKDRLRRLLDTTSQE